MGIRGLQPSKLSKAQRHEDRIRDDGDFQMRYLVNHSG